MFEWVLIVNIWTAGQPATSKPRKIEIPYETQAACQKGAAKYRSELAKSNPYGMNTVVCFDTAILKEVVAVQPPGVRRKQWARTPEEREAAAPSLKQTVQPPK